MLTRVSGICMRIMQLRPLIVHPVLAGTENCDSRFAEASLGFARDRIRGSL